MDGDDYGLLLHDPEGSSEETGVYGDADTEEDTGVTPDRRPSEEGRRHRDAALVMPEMLYAESG